MFNPTLIFIDTKTGGTSPIRHSLLTVAFLVVQNNEIVNQKEWKIKHSTYQVTAKALEMNQIHLSQFDQEAIEKEQAGQEMIQFLSQYCSEENKGMLVGRNTTTDISFLEAFFKSLIDLTPYETYTKIISHHSVDIISITAFLSLAGIFSPDDLSLDAILEKLSIKPMTGHPSLDDAGATFEEYSKMLDLVRSKR